MSYTKTPLTLVPVLSFWLFPSRASSEFLRSWHDVSVIPPFCRSPLSKDSSFLCDFDLLHVSRTTIRTTLLSHKYYISKDSLGLLRTVQVDPRRQLMTSMLYNPFGSFQTYIRIKFRRLQHPFRNFLTATQFLGNQEQSFSKKTYYGGKVQLRLKSKENLNRATRGAHFQSSGRQICPKEENLHTSLRMRHPTLQILWFHGLEMACLFGQLWEDSEKYIV